MIQPQGSRAAAPATDGLASWYTPGLVDGFGDRLLMFDNTETDSLELLRFYPSLVEIAGFEEALHERVRQVGRIPDHAFPLIVAVERLEGDGALALVSTHTPGKRLSAFFDKPGPRRGLNPSFVTGIVTQAVQALTVLQSKGADITHSAITPDRIVVTTGGRVSVVEHVLGLALRHLNLSASQLWREFGLVSAPTESGAICLDARTDVFQLGVVALEMLLGRRLTPLDLKDRLPDLIDQWSVAVAPTGQESDRLRAWLENALQLSSYGYGTASEAYEDLRDIPSESPASAFESLTGDVDTIAKRSLQPARLAAGQDPHMANAPAPDEFTGSPLPVRPAVMPTDIRWADPFSPDVKPAPLAPRLREPVPAEPAPPAPSVPGARTAAPRRTVFRASRVSPWVAAALGVVVLLEGVVIAALIMRQPPAGAPATSNAGAPLAGSPIPASTSATPEPPAPAVPVDAATANETKTPPPRATDPLQAAVGIQRSGGVRFVTPIELKVLQGDKVLGSTADGPIILTAGTHQLDLINTALGFRTRQVVTFRSGQITPLNVTIPPGRVSVNAQPWAEVWINGVARGETPLANLSVPIGEHDILFRHPELGERRQTITVRGDGPTRVSVTLEK